MSIPLREATAGQEIPLGHFVSSTDGDTITTPTVANTDIKIWKRDATTLANKNSGGATHISNGVGYAVLDATDTNTTGPLVVWVKVTGSLGIRVECCVYPANVYDALFLGTDALDVSVIQWLGTAPLALSSQRVQSLVGAMSADTITATAIQDNAITANKIASGALTAAKFAAGAFDAVWSVTARLLTAGTNIVLAKGTGITGFNDLSAAQVNTEVDTALADVNLDHIAGTATAIPAIPAGTYLDQMMDDGTAVYDRTTDSLQAIRDRGDAAWTAGAAAPTAADVADAVWDEARSGHLAVGSFGENVNIPAATQTQVDGIEDGMAFLMGFATFGSVNDVAPTASGFTLSGDFTNTNDHYNGLKVYILSGAQKGRRAEITDQVGLVVTLGTGLTSAPENGAIVAIMS